MEAISNKKETKGKVINLDDAVCQYLYDLIQDKNAENSPARITAIAELFKIAREKFEKKFDE